MSPAAKRPADSKHSNPTDGVSPRRSVRMARELLKEARTLLKKKRRKVSPQAIEETEAAVADLAALLPAKRKDPIPQAEITTQLGRLDRTLSDHFGRWRKTTFREYVEAIAWAVGLALIIRAFIFEAFSIPSGSMMPTLQIGDYLFVDKVTHGLYIPFSPRRLIRWSEPDRGDIIVFEYDNPGDPHDGEDFIKRVVAVPGDSVKLENNRLVINGARVPTDVTEPDAICDFYGEDNATEPLYQCPCVRQTETLGAGRDPAAWDASYTTQHVKDGIALQKGCLMDCSTKVSGCAKEPSGPHSNACMICVAQCVQLCGGQNKANWSLSEVTRRSAFDYVPVSKFRPSQCRESEVDSDFAAGIPGCDAYDERSDLVVPDDHVFVMGDNRDHSKDGRFWGLVPSHRIKGRAFVIWMARDKSRMFNLL